MPRSMRRESYPPAPRPAHIAFDKFDVDTRSGELRKNGSRIHLQAQPFQLLVFLLRNAGEVVTRDEICSNLWPSDTFVDFEHSLAAAVNKVRDALGDSAENPKYIETLPKRGYRFIGKITPEAPVVMPAPESQERIELQPLSAPVTQENRDSTRMEPLGKTRRFTRQAASAVALAAIATAVSASWFSSGKPHPLTERDTIVLADFANDTGDPVFDGTLRQGLSVQLAQSPFLSVLPDKQVRQTLLMMKQPADAKLTSDVATEVCRRNNSTALVNGSIAQIGTQYSLILKAEDCSNGNVIASTEAGATDKSYVLDALGKASTSLRKKLGESLAMVEKFDTPLEQATTSSLPALQAYDAGYKLADKGDYATALPFFQQARNLDPNFAMASLLLGMMQWNLVHEKDAATNLQRAFDQRSTVSERERLFIEVEYYQTKETQDAEDALNVAASLFAKTYPRDCVARGELGALLTGKEQFDKALVQIKEAHRLCPGDGLTSAALINTYISLNLFPEARAVSEETLAKELDSFEVHNALYRLAFLQDDATAMEREVNFASAKPGLEDRLWYLQADTAAYHGRMKDSREFSSKAVASAFAAGEGERAVLDAEVEALREAYVGNLTVARRQLSTALRLPNAANAGSWVVLELWALLGEEDRYKPLARKYASENANNLYVQNILLPAWAALLALARHDAPAAVEILRPRPYESRFHCPDNTYIRGLAYLANRQSREAAAEFQKIIQYRVLENGNLLGSLAHLQLGRALVLQGDTSGARASYQNFLALWKNADPDLPIVQEAKAEYARLQ
jgi:eukaryotic-like serine/threonine-protein kinase